MKKKVLSYAINARTFELFVEPFICTILSKNSRDIFKLEIFYF